MRNRKGQNAGELTMPLPKIAKGNLSEQVYETIRASLMDGRYEPGERLTIASLAEQLGVSITPVREAIFRLVTERALEMRAATSIHVRRLTADELRNSADPASA